jgi:hypothetical protein
LEYDLKQRFPARRGNSAVRANLKYLEKKAVSSYSTEREMRCAKARHATGEARDVNTLHRTPDVASTPTILPDTGTATISELRF